MKKKKIGYKSIVEKKEPCFLIVEAVVNHNDNIELQKSLDVKGEIYYDRRLAYLEPIEILR